DQRCLADTDLRRMCSDVRSHEDRVRRQLLPLMPEVMLGVPCGPEIRLFGPNGVCQCFLHMLGVVVRISRSDEAEKDRESHLCTFLFCEESTFRDRAKAWSWYRGQGVPASKRRHASASHSLPRTGPSPEYA